MSLALGGDGERADAFMAAHMGLERVRCSPRVDWPVYPRLGRNLRSSAPARNPASR
jgi:hypothetical protein